MIDKIKRVTKASKEDHQMKRMALGVMYVILAAVIVMLSIPIGFAENPPVQHRADQLRAEKSYQMAIKLYRELLQDKSLSDVQKRQIHIKLADCLWRAGGNKHINEAEKVLKEYIETKAQDQWWAEANESLAELYLQKDRWSFSNEIKLYLENTREYWAGHSDINIARARFIKASFTLGDYISQNWGWYYRGIKATALSEATLPVVQQNTYGLDVLYKEILKVAKTNSDKAKAHYSLAMSYYHLVHNEKEQALFEEHIKEIIENYARSEWVDDAYYYLGQYYERVTDFRQAITAYKDLLMRFKKGDSKWVNNAQQRIKDITLPQLGVGISYTFLPDSEIQFSMRWKNISEAHMSIYQLDLPEELQLNYSKSESDSQRGIDHYSRLIERIVKNKRYQTLPLIVSWKLRLKNEGKHIWYSENKGLAEWRQEKGEEQVQSAKGILPPGAYLILAEYASKKVYDLILVTDMGLVTKTSGSSTIFYTFDSKNGTPRTDTQVKYQYRYYNDQGQWLWAEGEGQTDATGILKVKLKNSKNRNYGNQHNLFACVSDGEQQAFAQGNYYPSHHGQGEWWLYAFSDRPAYRPKEEISFKGILRRNDGKRFINPEGMRIKAKIYDPRGNVVKEDSYILNAFGSFYDHILLDEKAPLGEYTIRVWPENMKQQLAQMPIFRLEEYKLPEFLVTIKPQKQDEKRKSSTYRVGDKIQIELDAQYYFGGAVANAEVEYLIYQNTYRHSYFPYKKYQWYYRDFWPHPHSYGHGQLIKQEKITTDELGKAHFSFTTPQEVGSDLKYYIEARVVDQSRREIKASTNIKVTRYGFYAYLTPKHNIYRPGDKAEIDIKTLTANEEPVEVEGQMTIYRNWWNNRVIKEGHVLKEAYYSKDKLYSKFVKTNNQGETKFDFQPEEEGYYTIQFTGYDEDGTSIDAYTHIYVCTKQSHDIGYRYSGLQIITEKDTYAIGETARIMIVSDQPDTWVLFTTEAGEIFHHQMIHLEGAVKLIELPITDAYTPNVFLTALAGGQYQLKMYQMPLIVPPEKKFLNVKIISDKEIYSPQEEGTFEIQVTDKEGQPVKGEVALGVVDKSIYYIQSDYAKDIREFFYGQKRQHMVRTQSSFNQRRYQRFVRGDKYQLMTEADKKRSEEQLHGQAIAPQSSVRQELLGANEGDMMLNGLEAEGLVSGMARTRGVGGSMKSAKKDVSMRFAAADMAAEPMLEMKEKMDSGGGRLGADKQLNQPQVRSDFRSTVYWHPTIQTDESGRAFVKTKFPDSLTTWKTTARVISTGTNVGNITHEIKTKKELIVRLQAPRFFTERDQVTISANVHNYTDQEQEIKVTLTAQDLDVQNDKFLWVKVPSLGEKRIDWTCVIPQVPPFGKTDIMVMAQTEKASDAMKRSYPVIPHGIEKFIARTLVVKGTPSAQSMSKFSFNLPAERIPTSTSLEITLSPSMAAAMLDALPYLANYPYGCVEQTMSRFLPSVIVAKTMRDLGLTEQQVSGYVSDVLDSRKDPLGHPGRSENSTVNKLQNITQVGLKRLYDFQHSDGGWGWWKEGDSDRFMSAYVLWGLSLARDAGLDVRKDVLSRGKNYVQKELIEEEDHADMLAWMLHALSVAQSSSSYEEKQRERLWEKREQLNPYTRALFALSEYNRKHFERAQVLSRNLINGLEKDNENGTAHWGEAGVHYRWSEGGIEATAFGIKALATINPQSPDMEPAVKWLALNRRGSRWKNTRDTAIAILGLSDYLKTTQELNPQYEFEIFLNGQSIRKGSVDASNLFSFSRKIELPNEVLVDGKNEIKVALQGKGSLYVAGYLKYFTLEEDISPAGNEVFVKREYFKEAKKETLLKGYVSEWSPLENGEKIKSGERIRVEIILEAKNHYEYLVIEDYKPAGFEAVELKSGSGYAETLDEAHNKTNHRIWLYQEFRDQKVAFFVSKLPQGTHKIVYELRAEVPGKFHGMPNQVHAMYVPEIRANSSEMRVTIEDHPVPE